MEIVQVMPGRKRNLIAILAVGALFAAPGVIVAQHMDTAPDDLISFEEVMENEAYPDIETAPKVILVGVGCGPDKETILMDGEEDDFPIWGCENIEAHSVEKG